MTKISACLAALLVVFSAGTAVAWTEKGDRELRAQRASAAASARAATRERLSAESRRAEAIRLASVNDINERNYEGYFDVAEDEFEKLRVFFPKVVLADWLEDYYGPQKNYAVESGFFAPAALVGTGFSCRTRIVFFPKSPKPLRSATFLFDDGETATLEKNALREEMRDAKSTTYPMRLEITEKGTFSGRGNGSFSVRDLHLSASELKGDWSGEVKGSGERRYVVTGTPATKEISWTQVFGAEISDELLEKISASRRVRVRFLHSEFEKTDRELSPPELAAFRSLSRLKKILKAQ